MGRGGNCPFLATYVTGCARRSNMGRSVVEDSQRRRHTLGLGSIVVDIYMILPRAVVNPIQIRFWSFGILRLGFRSMRSCAAVPPDQGYPPETAGRTVALPDRKRAGACDALAWNYAGVP